MTVTPAKPDRPKADWRLISLLLVAGVIAVVVAANAHLVWVAVTSQPDCTVQAGAMTEGGLQPARRAC
ncbi:MAG: hypothetical protein J0L52_09070 [Caulobacterales bacterium]|nr:hypothetical protein [Caulobacterales bacterium]